MDGRWNVVRDSRRVLVSVDRIPRSSTRLFCSAGGRSIACGSTSPTPYGKAIGAIADDAGNALGITHRGRSTMNGSAERRLRGTVLVARWSSDASGQVAG